MSFFQRAILLVSAISSLVHVRAAPAPEHVQLAQKYAPQFRFHREEEHFPSTVEYFFAGPVSLYNKDGPYIGAPSPLTNENLVGLPDQGRKTYITANIEVDLYDFLKGQNPEKSQPTTYAFIAPKPKGVIDLYYWIFCPFNFGKKTILFGDKDFHFGDWEHITVRTVDGLPQYVNYPSRLSAGSGIMPWAEVPKFSPSSPKASPDPGNSDPNARPVAYVALGTHNMYASVGKFTYHKAMLFKLEDATSDGGVYWDTQGNLTAINIYDSFTGSLNWVNYLGDWGNKGFNKCWKEGPHEVCNIESGPIGPLRMDGLNQKRDVSQTLPENLRTGD